jgi:site-specific recombinase XerD
MTISPRIAIIIAEKQKTPPKVLSYGTARFESLRQWPLGRVMFLGPEGKRDRAILAILLGCGLRRRELADLEFTHIQQREDHWAIVDLVGKGGHIRTAPMPGWVKAAVDLWVAAAGISAGRLFRCVCRAGKHWGDGVTERVVWHVVKQYAKKLGFARLAPHDLRRSCVYQCFPSPCRITPIPLKWTAKLPGSPIKGDVK